MNTRDAYNKRMREIYRENRDILAVADINDILSYEFDVDTHFVKSSGEYIYQYHIIDNIYAIISFSADNYTQLKIEICDFHNRPYNIIAKEYYFNKNGEDIIDDIYDIIEKLCDKNNIDF